MDSMVVKILLALCIPGLLVLLFTRITYSPYVALVLSIALIAASVYAGYTRPSLIYIIDAFSITVGFWYATRKMQPGKKRG